MYYMYLLKSLRDNKLYIGFTNDLFSRKSKHDQGKVFSTSWRRPLELVYFEGYKSLADARRREKNLKLFSKAYYSLKKRIPLSLSGE